MEDRDLPDVGAFGATFRAFMDAMTQAARGGRSPLADRLREHLGTDPAELPFTAADFSPAEHANLQLGLEAVAGDAEVIGFAMPHIGYESIGLGALITESAMAELLRPGPVQYTDVEVGDGRVVQCVSSGVYLVRHDGEPLVVLLSRSQTPFGGFTLRLEGVGRQGAVPAFFGDLRQAMREHNVFRGRVISLHADEQRNASVQFHHLERVERDAVILPAGTLERLERHAIGIAAEAPRLRAAGRHLKRGILLHGPPGTGKTLTVTYLVGAMPGRTTVLLTGRGLALIEEAIGIARQLAPATVVFEDIDLVAAERTFEFGDHGILFELLNQMEGLGGDEDLLFVLTTNRPDILEPALAARPGRVDLAVEVPLPDADGRRRLLDLYAAGIALDDATAQAIVDRTDGTPGAFFRELVRQAMLRSALDGDGTTRGSDVVAALDELLDDRATLTRRLLGQPGPGGIATPPHPSMIHAMGAAGLALPDDDD